MKKSRRSFPNCTNQIGRGIGQDEPTFEIVRPPEDNYFSIEVKQSRSFKQSHAAREISYRAKLKNPAQHVPLGDLLPQLHALFETLLAETRRNYGDAGVMRIYISHPQLESAIIIPPTFLGDLTSEDILRKIDNVLYSAGSIPADDEIDINVAVVEFLSGSGRYTVLDLDKDLINKRAIVTIRNRDNTCLPRAIVVGFTHLLSKLYPDENTTRLYNRIRDPRCNLQRDEAIRIRNEIGIPPNRPGTIEDIYKYEDHLKTSIVVISARAGNRKVYPGSDKYENKIFLYHYGKPGYAHFDTIVKVNALLNKSYYCDICDKGFQNRNGHKCVQWCNVCGRDNCKKEGNWGTCPDCNKNVRSKECFIDHKKQKRGKGKMKNANLPSMCEQFWDCKECGAGMKRNEKATHECGELKCGNCAENYMIYEQHECYMRNFTSDIHPDKFIFYDFECTQETGKHEPNFVVAHSICNQCEDNPVTAEATCKNCGSRCMLCDKFNEKEKDWERDPCKGCGKRQVIFRGPDTKNLFCKWLIHKQHKDFTVIAHNARGYDSYFIYDYLIENSHAPEPVIFSGSKIMYMKVPTGGINIRLLDSLNFLPMPLAQLPKSFGLVELKKGFFPHYYNIAEHQNDVLLNLPDVKYYDPDSMSEERREEFFKWYEENKNKVFGFQKEMEEYCISDVDILLKACWKFRQLLKSVTGTKTEIEDLENLMTTTMYEHAVDSFSFLTIASVCMGIFRGKFLTETWSVLTKENCVENCKHDKDCVCEWLEGRVINSSTPLEVLWNGQWEPRSKFKITKEKFVKSPIGLVPVHGYGCKDTHSRESIEWLSVLENQWNAAGKSIEIQHARSPQGEKVITCQGLTKPVHYKVDGYFEYEGKKYVCEYNGCNFHGCKTCFPHSRDSHMNNRISMEQRWKNTKLKEKRLTEQGYIVLSKWSCEFVQDIKDINIGGYVRSLNIQDPINLRDCYFGGRTNGIVLHKKFTDGEKGKYVDFTSLYPDILKYKRFPVGHPERIIKDFEPLMLRPCEGNCIYHPCHKLHWELPYFGVMKVTILPPVDLLFPVLPLKCNDKLKFPLCYKCACNENKEMCQCLDSERMFTHSYCTPEIEVALNMGYIIIQIHEVLHWNETEMYDPATKQGGLFTQYINTFLKLKQEASGYPPHIKTEKEKDKYIQEYLDHEGILLDKQSIVKNAGLRSLSKLALNSFYGKFGQRTNMKKTLFIKDIKTLMNTLTDPSKVLKDFHIMNDDVIQVEYKNTEDFEQQSFNTNVVIAAFCTSWARLKLWSVMERLGNRVLYHDTDSIIYSVKEGEYNPPLGSYLGQLTDELSCKELGCSTENCAGHWIVEFVSCGPKNYSFKVNTGEVVCKVRGFSLNYKSSLILNFNSMKEALISWKKNTPKELITVKTEIRRSKTDRTVFNRVIAKHYGVVYDKRIVKPDFTTVPFGYRK